MGAARQIYDPGQNDQTIGNQIVVQPDGTLVDILADATTRTRTSSAAGRCACFAPRTRG